MHFHFILNDGLVPSDLVPTQSFAPWQEISASQPLVRISEEGFLAPLSLSFSGLSEKTFARVAEAVQILTEETITPETARFYGISANNNSHRRFAIIEMSFKLNDGTEAQFLHKQTHIFEEKLRAGELGRIMAQSSLPDRPKNSPFITPCGPGLPPYYPEIL